MNEERLECGREHTLFTSQRERERECGREHTLFNSQRERWRERWRERGRERKRERERKKDSLIRNKFFNCPELTDVGSLNI